VEGSLFMSVVVNSTDKDEKLNEAIDMYSNGQVSLWKAARMAGISLWEMMEIVSERKIPAQYERRELEKDSEAVLKWKK